jgi:sec-independent protein translocase protein TatC
MDSKELTVWGHLEELRNRLIKSILAILAVAGVAFFFSNDILTILLLPAGGMHLIGLNIMDGFMIRWQIALYTGVAIAFPIWAYHIYKFISPGLYQTERQAIFPMLFGSMILFLIGACFGYYLLWEMVKVMIDLFPSQISYLPNAESYISFVLFILIAFGLAFQLPTLILILVRLRILTTTTLRKRRKIAYFILFVFAEVVTPVTDPIVAPLAVMIPLLILYEGSILVASKVEAGRKQELPAAT